MAELQPNSKIQTFAEQALRRMCLYMPALSGLAHVVDLKPSRLVPLAGVTASGRVLYNPDFLATLSQQEAIFVMAHELMHLVLRSHERQGNTNPEIVNIAHDYIINDLVAKETGLKPLEGSLYQPGMGQYSLEQALLMMKSQGLTQPERWKGSGGAARTAMGDAMTRAGFPPAQTPVLEWDVITGEQERKHLPEDSRIREQRRQQVERAASSAAAREAIWRALEKGPAEQSSAEIEALRTTYQPPWESALQRWLEAHAGSTRTFARASRRGASRSDVVLAGRNRGGWVLHIILDTSGSMEADLATALGAIASFAAAAGVSQIHLIQADVEITEEAWVEPEDLDRFRIKGFGGSDMSPAMLHLAQDPEVEAVVLITDGAIEYPQQTPPYQVLWALTGASFDFDPPYGFVIEIAA